MNYTDLINKIAADIVPGLSKGVNAEKLKELFNDIAQFANETRGDYQGSAAPADDPGTPTNSVYYIAESDGTYTNFGGLSVTAADGLNILSFVPGTGWSKTVVPIDLSSYAGKDKIIGLQKAESINLFNKETVNEDVFVNWTNGGLSANTSHMSSDYIPVESGESYFASGNIQSPVSVRIAWYNVNKGFISGVEIPSFPEVAPVGAVYMRISTGELNIDTFQVEKGISASSYTPYKLQFTDPFLSITAEQTTGLRKTSQKIIPIDLEIILPSINLFDKSKLTIDRFVNWTNGGLSTTTSYFASDWIPVNPLTNYMLSGNLISVTTHIAWYDKDQNFISGFNNPNYPILSPENAAFARFSAGNGNEDTLMINEGEEALPLSPYGFRFSSEISNQPFEEVLTIKWTSEGDSITQQNRWQPTVLTSLGNLILTNTGVAGSRLSGGAADAVWQDARVNSIPSDSQLITLLCGTNDWAQSAAIGTETSTDTNEFKGAFNIWVGKIMARCPNALIFICTTPVGKRLDISGYPGWANNFSNNLGLTSSDYAQALREMAKKWNFPVIDFNTLGWNTYNIEDFCPDGFHPSLEVGAPRLANRAIHELKYIAR